MISNIKIGDRVVFNSEEKHVKYPNTYPKPGTTGIVSFVSEDTKVIQVIWESGSTSADDTFFCSYLDVYTY